MNDPFLVAISLDALTKADTLKKQKEALSQMSDDVIAKYPRPGSGQIAAARLIIKRFKEGTSDMAPTEYVYKVAELERYPGEFTDRRIRQSS